MMEFKVATHKFLPKRLGSQRKTSLLTELNSDINAKPIFATPVYLAFLSEEGDRVW